MKINWKALLICLFIPLAVGGLAALITGGNMADFASLEKPPLSPPGWLFPVVWTVLYVFMGIASYRIVSANAPQRQTDAALRLYAVQLLVNFIWPILFFNLKLYGISFIWLLLLWVLILITMIRFYRIMPDAAYWLIPYFLWVSFAGYLNLGIALLNR